MEKITENSNNNLNYSVYFFSIINYIRNLPYLGSSVNWSKKTELFSKEF